MFQTECATIPEDAPFLRNVVTTTPGKQPPEQYGSSTWFVDDGEMGIPPKGTGSRVSPSGAAPPASPLFRMELGPVCERAADASYASLPGPMPDTTRVN
jgi:hypothetical protein